MSQNTDDPPGELADRIRVAQAADAADPSGLALRAIQVELEARNRGQSGG